MSFTRRFIKKFLENYELNAVLLIFFVVILSIMITSLVYYWESSNIFYELICLTFFGISLFSLWVETKLVIRLCRNVYESVQLDCNQGNAYCATCAKEEARQIRLQFAQR